MARSVPAGYHNVEPWIVTKDTAQLLEFLELAFGARETARDLNPDGTIGHAEARIGDSNVLMFDGKADWPTTPVFLRLYVDDCEATYRQALKSGAKAVTEPTLLMFGDRVARIRDPFGNIWWIHSHVENVSPEEVECRASEQKYIDAMQYVQSSLQEELSSGSPEIS